MKIEVPYYKQDTSYTCAAAALQMAFSFLGRKKSQSRLAKKLKASKKDGVKNSNLVKTALEEGFYAYVNEDAHPAEIEYWLSRELPVMINYIEPSNNEGHFALITGRKNNFFILNSSFIFNDPWNGQDFSIDRNEFVSRWRGEDGKHRWLLVLSKEDLSVGRQFLPKK